MSENRVSEYRKSRPNPRHTTNNSHFVKKFAVRKNCRWSVCPGLSASSNGHRVPVAHPSRNIEHVLSQPTAEKVHVLARVIAGYQRSWALRRLTLVTGRTSTDISARFAQHEDGVQASSEWAQGSGGARHRVSRRRRPRRRYVRACAGGLNMHGCKAQLTSRLVGCRRTACRRSNGQRRWSVRRCGRAAVLRVETIGIGTSGRAGGLNNMHAFMAGLTFPLMSWCRCTT
jgi:hypothetical protein